MSFLDLRSWINLVIVSMFLSVVAACNDVGNKAHPRDKSVPSSVSDSNSGEPMPVVSAVEIKLDPIFPIPDTIDGCGDYYSYDSVDLKREKYIFLSRMSEVAIISLNDSIIYLNNNTLASKSTEDVIHEEFEGNGILAILEVRKYKQYSEGGFFSGSLTIIRGSKKEILKVHGQSGC